MSVWKTVGNVRAQNLIHAGWLLPGGYAADAPFYVTVRTERGLFTARPSSPSSLSAG